MIINKLKYPFTAALKSFKRNKTISFVSVVTVAATLFIMGIFIIFMQNINVGMKNVESQIEIKVFFKNTITKVEQENIYNEIDKISGIKTIDIEDKAEALEKFNRQLSENGSSLLSNYDSSNNPLPDSYVVQLENPEVSQQVISSIENMPGIESIGNDKDFTDKIITISRNVQWIGTILFILMMSTSILLISNTIKLSIYSREKEIGIMKSIGATDWFIRWPFIIEGAIIGLTGAISANFLLYYLYKIVFVKINENLLLANLLSPSYVTQTLQWQFILVGVLIGSLGSLWSLFKFLKV
jgi:cell division transport system permease protein